MDGPRVDGDGDGEDEGDVTPWELARLEQAIAVKRAAAARRSPASYIRQTPTSKQREFLSLTCREALYGGAAGGGKSSALLMGALAHVHVPGYAALILRRTYKDLALPGAIMDRAQEWLAGTGARWNGDDKRWTFPSGATLTFGYCETARDVFRYQGAEIQYLGVDELTQWPEKSYRYLLSRLRRLAGSDVPIHARAGANPGGIGHEWVKRRFIDPATAVASFVPALLDDNPHLDAEEYRATLALLDTATRKQLLEGLWVRDAGGLVYQYDSTRNAASAVPRLDFYLLGIDYGFNDECAFTVLGWRAHDPTVYVVESYKLEHATPSRAAEEVHRLNERYRFVQMVADTGGLGKGYAEEARTRFQLPIEQAEKQNKRGYISLLNGDLERGRIRVVTEKCVELVAEWAELPWDEEHKAECDGFANHCADATLYAWRAANAFHEREPAPPPTKEEQLRAEEVALEEADEAEAARRSAPWWAAA